MKKCSKCGVEKPLDEFYLTRGRPHGSCKECMKAKARTNYAQNAAARVAQKHDYRRKNADAINARRRAHYRDNRDEILADQRETYRTSAHRRASMKQALHRRRARIAAAVPQRWRKSETPEALCYWCGCDLAETVTHIEHLMPIALGGPAEAYNEAPACEACNLAKSDTHPLVWLAHQF